MSDRRILREGHDYWRLCRAGRVATLVDGADYYASVHEALRRARRRVMILGWDINRHTRLVRPRDGTARGPALGRLLEQRLRVRPKLDVFVLAWDFAMIYALEREPVPVYALGWRRHRRLHFQLDGEHPVGASHHQKIIVVDDALAFCGGMDIAPWRWDTREHRPDDPRRTDRNGRRYGPVHDIQLAVDGDAAATLAELARERWRRATGASLEPCAPSRADPWPRRVPVDFRDVLVAVARTDPEYAGRPQVREAEALYLDAIASAREVIYLENQYLTSHAIGEALSARLAEPHGPEVILVLPRESPGWLEETTMGVLRARLLRRLRDADHHGRLHVYTPVVGDGRGVIVHSKLLIVDDALLRVGSANASNRSMGLDTECDLAIEAGGEAPIASGVAAVRDGLLAEHLNIDVERLRAARTEHASLAATVEALRGEAGTRTLVPLSGEVPETLDRLVPDTALLDPEQPVAADTLVRELVPEELRRPADHSLRRFVTILALLLGIAAAWRFTPLGEWLDPRTLAEWNRSIITHPAAPLLVVGSYVVASIVMVPVTLLIAATALAFGPVTGFVYALVSSVIAALVTYALGLLTGRGMLGRLQSNTVNALSRRLAQRGLMAIIAVRLVPVAPFTLINIAAGALRVRLRDFALGTLIGMTPGVLAMTVFTHQLIAAIQRPGPWTLAGLAVLGLVLVAAAAWLRRRLATSPDRSETGTSVDE